MKAWVLHEFGSPTGMQLEDIAMPEPGLGEVRIEVRAIAVARTKDVATRAGRPPFAPRISLPHILGTEHAGIVDAVGAGVDPGLIGRRVAVSAVLSCGACRACSLDREEACSSFRLIGVDRPGCYAEYSIAPAGNVYPLPDAVSLGQAAALAANGPIARAQLDSGGVSEGSYVLVPGAAGALGSAVAALAHHRGARVIAVDQLDTKRSLLERLPVDILLDGRDDALTAQILAATDGWGVDCVVDNLGIVDLWNRYRPALADMGRIIVSGAIGREPIAMELLPFYLRSQSLIGVRTGNRAQMRALWQDVADGFRLPDAALTERDWTGMREAHAAVEQGRAQAQTVMTLG